MRNAYNNRALASDANGMYHYFTIDESLYGIEARHVLLVTEMRRIHKTPDMPYGLKGFLDFRGGRIPVYSLHARYLKAKPGTARIVVISNEDEPFGLIVDTIQEYIPFEHDNACLCPDSGHAQTCRYISGVMQLPEERTVLLLTRICG